MAYSSVKAMLNVSRQNNQPLWDVILQSDLLESGLTRPQSLAEMHHLWQVMVQTSDNYCGADRSASGFAGGDAAKVAEAEARGQLLTGGYLAQVMAEALKTAECNACMKRIVDGGSKLWVNSLWSSLCGGLDDDKAFEGGPAAIYGKLIDMGATLIQTDRPELLISYLRSRGLHD